MGAIIEQVDKNRYAQFLEAVANLRISIFREYPYLYDGDMAYEKRYLSSLADAQYPLLAIVRDEGHIVGATTSMALNEAAAEFQHAFMEHGEGVDEYYYCAETVLLPQYRGQGLYRSLFEVREEMARHFGARYCTFCSVVRPDKHKHKPKNYRPLDDIWRHLGYLPMDGFEASLDWKEIDSPHEISHQLKFWRKAI